MTILPKRFNTDALDSSESLSSSSEFAFSSSGSSDSSSAWLGLISSFASGFSVQEFSEGSVSSFDEESTASALSSPDFSSSVFASSAFASSASSSSLVSSESSADSDSSALTFFFKNVFRIKDFRPLVTLSCPSSSFSSNSSSLTSSESASSSRLFLYFFLKIFLTILFSSDSSSGMISVITASSASG